MFIKKGFLATFLAVIILLPSFSFAQEGLIGGQGSSLIIRQGENLKVIKEELNIKLHIGFAEVEQILTLQNSGISQTAVLGLKQKLDNSQSENTLNNFNLEVNNSNVELITSRQKEGDSLVLWRTLETQFSPHETKIIKLSHWQLNGANLRGMRAFSYQLKNCNLGKIGRFELKLKLMDGLSIAYFNKTTNPDLDLKLEPFGWQEMSEILSWHWNDFEPAFDIAANFYWQNGDLARISSLSQNLSLYQASASFDSTSAWQAVDSSYLTAWPEKEGPVVGGKLEVDFDSPRIVNEIGIIPGKATSLEDFKANNRPRHLTFDFGQYQQEVELADRLAMQYFVLNKPIETDSVSIIVDSVWPGAINNNKTYISEVEFGQNFSKNVLAAEKTDVKQINPIKKFFVSLWQKIVRFLKNIF